jgi:hypothetical protein
MCLLEVAGDNIVDETMTRYKDTPTPYSPHAHERPQNPFQPPPAPSFPDLSKFDLACKTSTLKFRALYTKHQKPPNGKRIITEGDEICYHFVSFKLGTKSLEVICIGQQDWFAGWEDYNPRKDNELFETGRFALKEVVDRDTYLGDKTIWLFEAEECIWYSKPYLIAA